MTLEEIAEGVKEYSRAWAEAHNSELDKVSNTPQIARQIVTFIEEAARHPRAITGQTTDAVKNALKLTALSNFRFGLLTGLLLWKPEQADNVVTLPAPDESRPVQACMPCMTTGIVCHECSRDSSRCKCGMGKFSPVKCADCNGEGWV